MYWTNDCNDLDRSHQVLSDFLLRKLSVEFFYGKKGFPGFRFIASPRALYGLQSFNNFLWFSCGGLQ